MKGPFDGGYDWICDGCGAVMNDQPGFNVYSGTWRCTECGALNDVTENNVIDILGMIKDGVEEFTVHPLDYLDDEDDY